MSMEIIVENRELYSYLKPIVRGQVKHTKNGHKVYHFLSKGNWVDSGS